MFIVLYYRCILLLLFLTSVVKIPRVKISKKVLDLLLLLLLLLLLKMKRLDSDTMRERCRGTLHSQCPMPAYAKES